LINGELWEWWFVSPFEVEEGGARRGLKLDEGQAKSERGAQ